MPMPSLAEVTYTFSHFVAVAAHPSPFFFEPNMFAMRVGANPPCRSGCAPCMTTSVKATAEASRGECAVQRARKALGGAGERHCVWVN